MLELTQQSRSPCVDPQLFFPAFAVQYLLFSTFLIFPAFFSFPRYIQNILATEVFSPTFLIFERKSVTYFRTDMTHSLERPFRWLDSSNTIFFFASVITLPCSIFPFSLCNSHPYLGRPCLHLEFDSKYDIFFLPYYIHGT